MIRRPPRSTPLYSSAASDVYKRQADGWELVQVVQGPDAGLVAYLSLIHISEPTRLRRISYAVFCLKKKKQHLPHQLSKSTAEKKHYNNSPTADHKQAE